MTAQVVSHFERRSINQGTAKKIRQSGFYAEMTNSGNALLRHETGSIADGQLWQRVAEGKRRD